MSKLDKFKGIGVSLTGLGSFAYFAALKHEEDIATYMIHNNEPDYEKANVIIQVSKTHLMSLDKAREHVETLLDAGFTIEDIRQGAHGKL